MRWHGRLAREVFRRVRFSGRKPRTAGAPLAYTFPAPPEVTITHMAKASPRTCLLLGIVFMMFALLLQNVTLASGQYAGTLLMALGLAVAADACFACVAWRRGSAWRVAAGIAALPTLFVIADFLRRAPHAF